MKRSILLVVAFLTALAALVPAAHAQQIGDTRVWARVPAPGAPEGIAVDGDVVYVGTHASVRGNGGDVASRIFTFDRATGGSPTGSIEITGQTTAATHGLLAMAFDAAGRLYVMDRNPPRIVRITPATGAQETYATIPDLHPCTLNAPPCAPATLDEPPFPDYLAFAPDGAAYVTDLQAATIFRVPAGGGTAQIWFQDPRLDGIFGPNGIALDAAGTSLYFAMTGSQQPQTPAQGIIYRLPLVASPAAADLQPFFTYFEPADGPDGITFGASGKLYVALAGSNQMSILNPDGTEAARFPDPVSNQLRDIPFDLPASIAFNDATRSLLVTNQSFFVANPDHWAVLEVYVDDTALPLVRPLITG